MWVANVVAFGLAYWELDCGGPVARALSTSSRRPDFQSPQDENPNLARQGWMPRLLDYLYLSFTKQHCASLVADLQRCRERAPEAQLQRVEQASGR